MAKITPMMEQYRRIKRENQDAILLFRLGDFYEMFEEDARLASRALNIALTSRNGVPMCGFPYHAADTYISKLLNEGRRVAICEQTEDPSLARGIVKREVVEVLSPGIITDPDLLSGSSSNAAASLCAREGKSGFWAACSALDVSTGDFISCCFQGGDIADDILNLIEDSGVREIVYPEYGDDLKNSGGDGFQTRGGGLHALLDRLKKARPGLFLHSLDESEFSLKRTEEVLKSHFRVSSLAGFEFEEELEIRACGAVLSYVADHVRKDISHVRWIKRKLIDDFLIIDSATQRHLELTRNQVDGGRDGTLLSVLDHTQTAMGGRLLKKSIHSPFRQIPRIQERLAKVDHLYRRREMLSLLRQHLGGVLDIERIVSKLSVGKGNARDLIGLKNSLVAIEAIREVISGIDIFRDEEASLGDFTRITGLIEGAVVDDPPLSVKEGRMMKSGYNQKLDEYREMSKNNREWINRYQMEEARKHGITSLKIRYNRIIGYFIEVTKPNLHLVPSYYIKKQTLVNSERFTTEELEQHETLLLESRQKSDAFEFQLFEEIRTSVISCTRELFRASEGAANLDLYCSLSLAAIENGYVKPEVVEDNLIEISDGRHPVLEVVGEEDFIANDLFLNDSDRRLMILTGPNMAGKSTYLRQAALIIIMAHMGSFVPARSARIGLVDRVFSRIGASDRLTMGESTFLVEMIETSRILHYATERSFIIMDEIGRGTSTYDGLSIAWAVLEYLLDEAGVGAKVLFATHYHEITALHDRYGVINCNATVKEWNGSVIFLRKIVPGSASKSYGIEVARMAGIPDSVVERAKEILSTLEMKYGGDLTLIRDREEGTQEPVGEDGGVQSEGISSDTVRDGKSGPSGRKRKRSPQFELFPSPYDVLIGELKHLDINEITPLEALNILDRLKKSISV